MKGRLHPLLAMGWIILFGGFLGSAEVEQHPWSPPTQCTQTWPSAPEEGWVRSPHTHTSFLKFAAKDKKGPYPVCSVGRA